MMTIANRLEQLADEHYEMLDDIHVPLLEARDEIKRLLMEVASYEDALLKIRDLDWPVDQAYIMRDIAREALENE